MNLVFLPYSKILASSSARTSFLSMLSSVFQDFSLYAFSSASSMAVNLSSKFEMTLCLCSRRRVCTWPKRLKTTKFLSLFR